MDKKLIAIDLDGTTLNSESKVSQKTINTLNKVIDLGHVVNIVSGRPPRLITDIYNQIGLDNPLISFNGSLGYNPLTEWNKAYEYNINRDIVFDVLQQDKELGINLMAVEGKELFLANREANDEVGFFPTSLKPSEFITQENLTENPICLTLQIEHNKMDKFINYVDQNYGDTLEISPWGGPDSIVELASKDVSKETGLEVLSDYYNIDQSNIIAFGDEFNDETMLKYAGLGVAMKNGQPKIKELADDVTKYDNDNDGLARYLDEYFEL
ncbi:5-amino-6-(5-phospho-D-ribitylamino)uracilphosphatase YitU [Apilactobacillus kunkeei]|nr:5-amino-6-(5-phospho-D-ribitylamino)uracilphosphatase YitU [Apilactobacillus kunkeei]CAI2595685.1 5-amino-6-(5-phospho-D-ribitylamino)uracilphosphatase YitU [Apilactobacillus kunkeei]CAI2802142.1 5-amino-6-(5-phospho-D-ribitylamino)uracilphosphatase YitU [Apilactobacillus kunkeei]